MRAAFISERAFYRKIQTLFIEKILTPIFEDWLDAACVSGELDLPPVLGNYDFYKQFSFTPKAYEFSNPVAEAEAQKILIESRVMSRSQICLERGSSYEKVLDDIKHEQELEKLKGVNFEVLPKSSMLSPIPEGVINTTPIAGDKKNE
jgi:capsid protein